MSSCETYTGPSVAHMLATRTFASSVISNHDTSNAILDDSELAFLKAFAADPSSAYYHLAIPHRASDLDVKLLLACFFVFLPIQCSAIFYATLTQWPSLLENDEMLSQRDMADAVGDRPGTRAGEKGSLTGLVVARCGTGEEALGEGDVEKLRGWFESGGAGG